jgi:hypothetical protein
MHANSTNVFSDSDHGLQVDVHEFLNGLTWHALPEAHTSLGNINPLERAKLRRKQIIEEVNAYIHAKQTPGRAESSHALKTDPVRLSSSSSKARTPRLPSRGKKLSIETQEMPPTVATAAPTKALQSVTHGWHDIGIDPRLVTESSQAHGLEWLAHDAVNCSTMQLFELEVAFSRKTSVEAIFFTRTPRVEQEKAEELPAQQAQDAEETQKNDESGGLDNKPADAKDDSGQGQDHGLLSWMPCHVREGAEKSGRIVAYSIGEDNGEGLGEFAAHAYASICAVVGANYASHEYDVQQKFEEQERMQRGRLEALVECITQRLEMASSKAATSPPHGDEHEPSQPKDAPSSSQSPLPPPDPEAVPTGAQGHDGDAHIQQGPTLSSRRKQYVEDLATWVTSEEAQSACVVGLLKSRACGASFVSEQCAMLLDTLWKAEGGGEQKCAEQDGAKVDAASENTGQDGGGGDGDAKKEQQRARPLKTCYFIRSVGVAAREIGPHLLGQLRGAPPYTKADEQEFKCGNELHDIPRQLLSMARDQTIDIVCVIDGLTAGERLRLIRGAARACQVCKQDANAGSVKIVLADDALLAHADSLMPPFVKHLPEPPVLEVCYAPLCACLLPIHNFSCKFCLNFVFHA